FRPVRFSNTFMLHALFGWKGINIDASPYAIQEFERARPDDINICAAVGVPQKRRTFWRFEEPAVSTLSEDNLKRQMQRGREPVEEREVEVVGLSSLLDLYLPEAQQIDFLNIDVEGLDIEV